MGLFRDYMGLFRDCMGLGVVGVLGFGAFRVHGFWARILGSIWQVMFSGFREDLG